MYIYRDRESVCVYIYIYIPNRMSQKFCNILLCASLPHIYLMNVAVQAVVGTHVVGSIMVVGMLTHFPPFDLKVSKVNV